MKTIKEIIESKKEEIKNLYFEMLSESYYIFYYKKCYIDNETYNIRIVDCNTKGEMSYGEYKGFETLLFIMEPHDYEDEGLTKFDNIEYLTSKEGLEDNDTQQDIFENLFNDIIREK